MLVSFIHKDLLLFFTDNRYFCDFFFQINPTQTEKLYNSALNMAEEVFPILYQEGRKAEVVVVDPPRKGLDPQVVDTVATMQPERIVYVSCNPNTLARDVKALIERGYTLTQVQPVDMFPHSMHVEAVVKLKLTLKNNTK